MIIYEEILRQFQKQKVKYVLVGGLAYNLLGGYRSTLDMDILVEMSDANLRKVVAILSKSGYDVKQPVDPMKIADRTTRLEWINKKQMKALNFYKSESGYEQVDIIIDSPVNYKEAVRSCSKIKVGGLTLPVISAANLIKMKKKSGRDLDLRDIAILKAIKNKKR